MDDDVPECVRCGGEEELAPSEDHAHAWLCAECADEIAIESWSHLRDVAIDQLIARDREESVTT